jgi:hypothetical protein
MKSPSTGLTPHRRWESGRLSKCMLGKRGN